MESEQHCQNDIRKSTLGQPKHKEPLSYLTERGGREILFHSYPSCIQMFLFSFHSCFHDEYFIFESLCDCFHILININECPIMDWPMKRWLTACVIINDNTACCLCISHVTGLLCHPLTALLFVFCCCVVSCCVVLCCGLVVVVPFRVVFCHVVTAHTVMPFVDSCVRGICVCVSS